MSHSPFLVSASPCLFIAPGLMIPWNKLSKKSAHSLHFLWDGADLLGCNKKFSSCSCVTIHLDGTMKNTQGQFIHCKLFPPRQKKMIELDYSFLKRKTGEWMYWEILQWHFSKRDSLLSKIFYAVNFLRNEAMLAINNVILLYGNVHSLCSPFTLFSHHYLASVKYLGTIFCAECQRAYGS